MGKSRSKVRPLTFEKWDNEKFVVRYNIEEKEDEEGGTMYEYNEVIVKELSRKGMIDALVAEKYDFNDEIALAFNREADAEAKSAHETYVAECKEIADEIFNNA